jgi:hypothetical protein
MLVIVTVALQRLQLGNRLPATTKLWLTAKLDGIVTKLMADCARRRTQNVCCSLHVANANKFVYAVSSDALVPFVDKLKLGECMAAEVALADTECRAAQLRLPQAQPSEIPTDTLRKVVAVKLVASIGDK